MAEKDIDAMSGIEQLQYLLVDNPSVGIAELVNMSIEFLDEGRVVFSIEPDTTMVNPLGTIHGGIAATLLDSVASCAVHSVLPPGTSYATTQLNVHFTRAVQSDGGKIIGVGEVVHQGSRLATARGTITDEAGNVIAHGSVTCSIGEAPSPPA